MKKRISFIFLALVLVVSLVAFAACNGEEEATPATPTTPTTPATPATPATPTTPTEPEPEPAWEWPELLAVLAPPVGSLGYGTMVGWTALLQEDTGMQVRCVPVGSGMENYKNLKEGRFFWYLNASSQVAGLMEGVGGYATRDLGPYQIRTIWPSYISGTAFMVRGDSDIRTPQDIKPGTKISYMVGTPMGKMPLDALVAWSGVDPDDIVWIPYTGFWDSLAMVAEGTVDITWTYPTAPSVFEAAAAPRGIGWIDLDWQADPEGAARFSEVWPTIGFGVNNLGAPGSVGLNTIIVITIHYTIAESDPELVYRICKWLGENFDSYQDLSDTLQFHHIDSVMKMVETDFIPAHEGLVRYLTEIGRWTPAHEARNQQNIEVITRYVEAYQSAITMAAEQQIEVSPKNEEWIGLWENYKKELNLPPFKMLIGLD